MVGAEAIIDAGSATPIGEIPPTEAVDALFQDGNWDEGMLPPVSQPSLFSPVSLPEVAFAPAKLDPRLAIGLTSLPASAPLASLATLDALFAGTAEGPRGTQFEFLPPPPPEEFTLGALLDSHGAAALPLDLPPAEEPTPSDEEDVSNLLFVAYGEDDPDPTTYVADEEVLAEAA
jgi:hypothetical protein